MRDAFLEHLRQSGRGAPLFVVLSLFGASAVFFGPVGIGVVLGLLGVYIAWFCVSIYRQQARFERLGRQPLASADLRVARNRLANSKTQRLVAEHSRRLKSQRLGRARATPLRLRHP